MGAPPAIYLLMIHKDIILDNLSRMQRFVKKDSKIHPAISTINIAPQIVELFIE